jgi:hypothetical protein
MGPTWLILTLLASSMSNGIAFDQGSVVGRLEIVSLSHTHYLDAITDVA